jgi:hypothetical protein
VLRPIELVVIEISTSCKTSYLSSLLFDRIVLSSSTKEDCRNKIRDCHLSALRSAASGNANKQETIETSDQCNNECEMHPREFAVGDAQACIIE